MLLTRAKASKELFKRGYRPGDYPGIWLDPINKLPVVWFVALQREKIKLNKKDKPWRNKQLEFKL
tara:strand:+ start:408 stop:602 length:195 start_codon:yes stop_codon:yes gene_type:complete